MGVCLLGVQVWGRGIVSLSFLEHFGVLNIGPMF